MPKIRIRVIDAYVYTKTNIEMKFLLLKRAKTKLYEHLWQGVAGKIEAGETSWEAAIRELKEETGYIGNNPKYLGYVDPNPAFQTNKCHTVLIQNCEKLDEQDLDPGEDIEVEVASEKSIQEYIDKGTIRHSLVLSAFRLYEIEKTS
mgnify:CR=1 FL=1